jgi:hypothetical protein
VVQPPIFIRIADSSFALNSQLPGAPLSQGKCPGGVDAFCRSASLAFHTDRVKFVYGRNGMTTLRAKIAIDLLSPAAPQFSGPVSLRVDDSNGYTIDVAFRFCVLKTRGNTATVTCYQ